MFNQAELDKDPCAMKEIIADMLSIQDRLNTVAIGEKWKFDNKSWCTAILVECAEGIEHLGWKWWKHNAVHIARAQVEVIDILHFALAWYMDNEGKPNTAESHDASIHYANFAEDIALAYEARYADVEFDGEMWNPGEMTPIELFRLIAGMACNNNVDLGVIFLLGEKLDLSFDQQTILYRSKATLNLFRQNHGYASGSYKKEWAGGLEDNDIMQSLIPSIEWDHPEASKYLYGKLEEYYSTVIA